MSPPSIEVVDGDGLAARTAEVIAGYLGVALDARGRATLALSGGRTPEPMFVALARSDVDWDLVDVLQVDERVAPDGDPARNLDPIRAAFVDGGTLPESRLHPMGVTEPDLEVEAERYGALIDALTGSSGLPMIDVIHLGLGPDGHTASLVPGDPVLEATDVRVGVTRPYQDHVRMTLTAPVLSLAREVVWMVSGAEKADALARLRRGDESIPASLVRAESSILLCDPSSAAGG